MFSVLSWFSFILAAIFCSPVLRDMARIGYRGLGPWEQKQIWALGGFALLGAFLGFQGVRNEERIASWGKLGMIVNLLALGAVAALEAKSRM